MNPSAGPSAAAPTPDRDHLPPGVERPAKGDPAVLGDHRVIGRVSRDAAGTVLLGTDTAGAASVIRVVPARLADAPEARARLEAEVDRLSRVRSLCAVAYRGADVRAAEPWLASAHAPGLTLAAHVAEHGPLTGGMLSALAAGVAEALAAGHAAGALHLALDPSRVIMSPEGPRVVDLGTVRATGQPLSPARWAAPEQRSGDPAGVTGYADVYAWGALVHFAATGTVPSGKPTGSVPAHLAPLVGRALAQVPEERPTVLEVLRELTMGEDPATAVSGLVAAEWTGVSTPRLRHVGRPRRTVAPFLLAGTAAVLVGALIGGGALVSTVGSPVGAGGPDTDDAAAEAAGEVVEEERTGPAVAEVPEDVDAVVADAVELALAASSFTTYDRLYTNDIGDQTQTHYRYTEEPQPAMSRTVHFGPSTNGELSFGEDLAELVHFAPENTGVIGGGERRYFRDPGPGSPETEAPRVLWEEKLRTLEGLTAEGAQVTYEGRSTIGDVEIPEELLGDVDPLERGGHHYTGTFDHRFVGLSHGPVEVEFDLWISEEGHPVRFVAVGVPEPGALAENGEPRSYTQHLDFMRFDLPVDVEVPEPTEIQATRP
ncbi:kinase [Nocardiopsis eucommiae]|uniref:kinase n=1 Tax=Nocardiopsis eucommiae TaxID=2831970 RepID=UPI003D74505B